MLTREMIEDIEADVDDEWYIIECSAPGYVQVTVASPKLREAGARFYNCDFENVDMDGWCDVYAWIHPLRKRVEKLFFDVVLHDQTVEHELIVDVDNEEEGKEIYDKLRESSGEYKDYFDNLINTAAVQIVAEIIEEKMA